MNRTTTTTTGSASSIKQWIYIFIGAQVVTNNEVEIWDHSSERMEFFSILSQRFGTR
jgi:hypothetical protein